MLYYGTEWNTVESEEWADKYSWIDFDGTRNMSKSNVSLKAKPNRIKKVSKKYDAELEYLQSDGTQYINTGLQSHSNIGWRVVCEPLGTTSYFTTMFGVGANDDSWYCQIYEMKSGSIISESFERGIGTCHRLDGKARVKTEATFNFMGDGMASINPNTNGAYSQIPIDLNKIKDHDVYICLFAAGSDAPGGVISHSKSRIYECQMSDGNTLVRDLIPVRVGNTGYMYDKVSDTLLGCGDENNPFTGECLGPDKTETIEENETEITEPTKTPIVTIGKRGGVSIGLKKSLPYDAEVEYLESTGTQYIDFPTQGTAGAYYGISGHITITEKPTNGRPFFDTNVSNQFYSQSYDTVSGGYIFGSIIGTVPTGGGYSFTIGSKTTFMVSTEGRTILGVFESLPRAITQNFSTFRLFKRLASPGSSVGVINTRVHDIKIFSGSTLEHDFIPVRFTNELGQSEGAMYDKVSGQLFRNQGSGSFNYGRDLPIPTTRDYIQDGLIAMWDGIENVGGGQHDENAELWKDLTGNGFDATFPSLNDREIGNDFVYYGDTQKINVAARCLLDNEKWSMISDGYTVEVVFSLKPGKTMADTRPYQAYSGLFSRDGGPNGVTWDFSSNRYRFGHNQHPSGMTDYQLYDTDAPIVNLNSGGIMSLTHTLTTTNYAMAMSGGIVRQASGTYTPVAALRGAARYDTLLLGAGGGQVGYNRNIAYMRVHCIRMYSRALTADEIAHNYSIDKIRFNLP